MGGGGEECLGFGWWVDWRGVWDKLVAWVENVHAFSIDILSALVTL